MTRRGLLLLASLLMCSSVNALSPATKEQLLCSATFLVRGTVASAERAPTKCTGPGVYGVTCAPGRVPGFAHLAVDVTEVLGKKSVVLKFPKDPGVAKGQLVKISIYDPKLEDPTIDVAGAFGGKSLIFGISVAYGDAWSKGVVLKNHLAEPPYGSKIWSPDDYHWISKVLSASNGESCPK